MPRTTRILLQTTTPAKPDDWSIDSLTLLREHLSGLREDGTRFEVVARNRQGLPGMPDPLLSRLDESVFDELWLFALDSGDGLTEADCEGITRFRQRGGGILATRDQQASGLGVFSERAARRPPVSLPRVKPCSFGCGRSRDAV